MTDIMSAICPRSLSSEIIDSPEMPNTSETYKKLHKELQSREMLIIIEQADDYLKDHNGQDVFRHFIEGLIHFIRMTITGEVERIPSKILIVSHARMDVIT